MQSYPCTLDPVITLPLFRCLLAILRRTLLSLWHLFCFPHGGVHSCEQDCLLAVPMPDIVTSFALERMGVSPDCVGGSHGIYTIIETRFSIVSTVESFFHIAKLNFHHIEVFSINQSPFYSLLYAFLDLF